MITVEKEMVINMVSSKNQFYYSILLIRILDCFGIRSLTSNFVVDKNVMVVM